MGLLEGQVAMMTGFGRGIYRAWIDEAMRRRWLEDKPLTMRKATSNKSLRITWVDGKTILVVNFYEQGEAKSQVTVQYTKLGDASEAERMKAFWRGRWSGWGDSVGE